MTTHSLVEDDCRDLSFVADASVHLIITHPPSPASFGEPAPPRRFPATSGYESYLAELGGVLAECERVLAPGGHFAFVASPVARSEEELPFSADLQARMCSLGLDPARSIRWVPSLTVEPDGAAFYGAPNQPCGAPPGDGQDILVLRKPGERRVSVETQVASRLPADYFAACSSSVWLIPEETDPLHPQSFPLE
ncbi:MAG: site-specific DNA-methyltransferase, partial [Actinomycetota bacterium]|nr:site-specific DNA-methyltransferase [Actinomycetota bacterium]